MNGLPVAKPPTFNQQEMEIPAGRNAVHVAVAGQSFVSLSQNDVEIVRSQTTEPVVAIVAEPGRYLLRSDGEIGTITFQTIALPPDPFKIPGELFGLALSSDAKDQHIVDGVGEIKADGRSWCVITVRKVGPDGQPMTGKKDTDEVFLRTTGGVLQNATGTKPIRSLKLAKGQGAFRLVSETQPKVVTITVLVAAAFPVSATLLIEFI